MGEDRHVRFTVEAGGVRARAVAFGTAGKIPCDADGPVDATFRLEINEWNGAVEPRLVLRCARPSAPAPIDGRGRGPCRSTPRSPSSTRRSIRVRGAAPAGDARDRRGGGIAGTITRSSPAASRCSSSRADAARRARHLDGRLGGFALTSHAALERDPRARGALRPRRRARPAARRRPGAAAPGPVVHLAWGARGSRLRAVDP